MSWSPAELIANHLAKHTGGVRASVVRFGRSGVAPLRLSIMLSKAVYEQLKKPSSVSVFVGHADHEGRIRISPAGTGGTDIQVGCGYWGGAARVVLARPVWLPDVAQRCQAVREEFDGKDLLITLPPGWRGATPAPAQRAPASNGTVSRSVNVTAAAMGDPPPGRSALALKR